MKDRSAETGPCGSLQLLDWATLAVVVFAVVSRGAREPWAAAVFAAGSALVWGARLVCGAATGQIRLLYSGIWLPAAGLVLLGGSQLIAPRPALDGASLAYPHTVEPYTTGLQVLLGTGYVALGLSVVHGFEGRRRMKILAPALFTLGIAESLFGLVQYFTGFTSFLDAPHHSDEARGTLANRNHFALLLNLAIAAGVSHLYTRSSELIPDRKLSWRRLLGMPELPRLAWIAAWIAIIGFGVIASLSRTGIFAMVASLAAMLVAARAVRGANRAAILLAGVLCAIAALGVYAGIGEVIERYAAIAERGYLDRYRLPTWREAWTMIGANPWFGQGLGSFQWTFPAYESWEPDTPAVFAHNDYLQVLAESGIAGLALVLWLAGACVRSAVRNLRAADPAVRGIGLAALGALSAAAIQEITDYSLYTPGVAAVLVCLLALNERATWSNS